MLKNFVNTILQLYKQKLIKKLTIHNETRTVIFILQQNVRCYKTFIYTNCLKNIVKYTKYTIYLMNVFTMLEQTNDIHKYNRSSLKGNKTRKPTIFLLVIVVLFNRASILKQTSQE